ncbi:MAG: insulinase family protein [Myxococcota bacterium]
MLLDNVERVDGKAQALADCWQRTGTADCLGAEWARYEAVTAADLARVASTYLTKPPFTLSNVPNTQPEAALPGPAGGAAVILALAVAPRARAADTVPEPAEAPEPAAPEPVTLGGPDRSAPPPVAAPELLVLPPAERIALRPGVDVVLVHAPGARKVDVRVRFQQGQIELDGAATMLGKSTGWLADAAAGKLSAAALSEAEDLHEATVESDIQLHTGGVDLEVPLDDLATGLDLQRLVLREPRFPGRDLKRYQLDQHVFFEVNGPRSAGAVAAAALNYAWFPADHPYGARPDLAALDRVKPKELRATWARWTHDAPMVVLVAGDVTWAQVEPALTAMVDGLGQAGARGTGLDVPPPEATRVVAVDLPAGDKGTQQVSIRMRLAAPADDGDDRGAMIALNDILGGMFLSRLNRNLREEKGLTYGASSRYQHADRWGAVTVTVDVRGEDLALALSEIERELQRLVDEPVDEPELEAARRLVAADWNRSFETAADVADVYGVAVERGRTIAESRSKVQAILDASPEALQRAARTWFARDRPRLWVLVGDRDDIAPALTQLGWDAAWVDPSAAILGNF